MPDMKDISFAGVGQGPFNDHAEGTPKHEIKTDEARTVLQNWIRVATFYMSRREVIEMLEIEANRLNS